MYKRLLLLTALIFILYGLHMKFRYMYQSPSSNGDVSYLEDEDFTSWGPEVVPRIIHQTWKDEKVPEKFEKNLKKCMDLNRNYTHMLWTDKSIRELIVQHYSWFIETFDNYRYPIQRVDAGRYFVLYHYGGLYLDLDVGCQKNLDPLLKFPAILPRTKPIGFSNDLLIFEKNHHFMFQILHSLPSYNWNFGTNYLTVMFSTGPMFVSLVFGNYLDVPGLRTLKPENYSGKTNSSFFYHTEGNTWHSDDAQFFLWLFNNPLFFLYMLPLILPMCAILIWFKKRSGRNFLDKCKDIKIV